MNDIRVRAAGSADEDLLRRLVAEAAVPEVVAASGGVVPGRAEAALTVDVVFLAEADGHPAGYVAVCERADRLVIDQLVVAPADQGRRVGHALLDWVEGYAMSRRLACVVVPTEDVDRRGMDFYVRRGFVATGDVLERSLVHL